MCALFTELGWFKKFNTESQVATLLLPKEVVPVVLGSKATPWLGLSVEEFKNLCISVGLLIAFLLTPRDTARLQTAGI